MPHSRAKVRKSGASDFKLVRYLRGSLFQVRQDLAFLGVATVAAGKAVVVVGSC